MKRPKRVINHQKEMSKNQETTGNKQNHQNKATRLLAVYKLVKVVCYEDCRCQSELFNTFQPFIQLAVQVHTDF